MPGHFIKIKNGVLKITCYWQPFLERDQGLNEDIAVEQLRGHLDNAIRLHLRSDVPVGAHLSGGLDSGTIVALAQRHLGKRIKSFSIGFDSAPEHDERFYIQTTSRHLKTEHYEFIPTATECLMAIPKIVKAMDEPQAGSGILGQYFLSHLVSRSVKVVLGGQGGDELFGGYHRYLPGLFQDTLKNKPLASLGQIQGILNHISRISLFKVLEKSQRKMGLLGLTTLEYKRSYDQNIPIGNGPLWDIRYFLPALLQVEDRTSMAFSIESRVPLLDHRLVEFAISLPLQLKMKHAQTKYLLRKAINNLLPKNIVLRKEKRGFTAPVNRWFRNEMRFLIEETLRSPKMKNRGIFDSNAVDEVLKTHMANKKDLSEQLWMLLNVELWFREFIDK